MAYGNRLNRNLKTGVLPRESQVGLVHSTITVEDTKGNSLEVENSKRFSAVI